MTKNEDKKKFMVFLCHGSEDKPAVRDIYTRLQLSGFNPWFDEKNILPGQDWDYEIINAIKQSHAILVCLSSTSVNKEGYINKEIKVALNVADEKPEGSIFVIPLRLDICEIPQRLRQWQWVNFFDKNGYDDVVKALKSRAYVCGISMDNSLYSDDPNTIYIGDLVPTKLPHRYIRYEVNAKFLSPKNMDMTSLRVMIGQMSGIIRDMSRNFFLNIDIWRLEFGKDKIDFIEEELQLYETGIRACMQDIFIDGIHCEIVEVSRKINVEYRS